MRFRGAACPHSRIAPRPTPKLPQWLLRPRLLHSRVAAEEAKPRAATAELPFVQVVAVQDSTAPPPSLARRIRRPSPAAVLATETERRFGMEWPWVFGQPSMN